MRKIKNTMESFLDLYLVPLIMCFVFLFIPILSIIAIIKFKHSLPNAIQITLGITEWVAVVSIVIVAAYWLQAYLKFPVPKVFDFVFKRIVTPLYGLLCLCAYVIVGGIGLQIFKRWPHLFDKISYYVATILCFTSGALVYKKGDFTVIHDGIPKVVIMYHGSGLDYALARIAMGHKQGCKIIIGENLNKYWLFDKYIERIGIIKKRDNTILNISLVKEMKATIEKGSNIGYFPTDGRNRVGQIRKKFETGGFSFALKYNLPIYPVLFFGAGKFCPPGPKSTNSTGKVPKGFFPLFRYHISAVVDGISMYFEGKADHLLLSPRPIKMEILTPISLFHLDGSKKNVEELTNEAQELMYNAIPEN